jgi:hypothetical protein
MESPKEKILVVRRKNGLVNWQTRKQEAWIIGR